MSVVVIIPARWASTRLPGKPLADIAGVPMIVHVLRRAAEARGVDRVLVATDDQRIANAVEQASGEAVMTRSDHASGTDRVAEVAVGLKAEVIVNLQGDLPLLEPGYIEAAVAALDAAASGDARAEMSTLATPLAGEEEARRPQVVKVVCDSFGNALYFSRSPIPSNLIATQAASADGGRDATGLRHIGLYAYRRAFLLHVASLSRTRLERAERLEQLRVLEHGFKIRVAVVDASEAMIEVDTPEDLDRVRGLLAAKLTRESMQPAPVAPLKLARERHG